jgi:hypothetical protein
MGGLANYKVEVETFQLKGGSVVLKGLSLVEITKLVHYHLPDLESIFNLGVSVMDGETQLTEDHINRIAIALAEHAPGFLANLIATSAGETDEASIQNAAKLPFITQIDMILAIVRLTFDEAGGVKKAFERLATLMKSDKLRTLMQKMSRK